MAVIFTTFEQIEIDGIASGNIVDVISNHAPKRLQVLEAYKVYTDKLNADHATALATAEAALATTTSQLEAVTAAKQALVDDVLVKTEQLALADSEYKLLEAKVAFLESIRTYDARRLDGVAFFNRVSKHDMVTLLASDDPMLVNVGKTIEAYRVNHWPVVLDSQDFQNLVGYVLQSGVFNEADVVAIMRDATREEAYRVPE